MVTLHLPIIVLSEKVWRTYRCPFSRLDGRGFEDTSGESC